MQVVFHMQAQALVVLKLDLEAKKAWPVYQADPMVSSLALPVEDRNYQGLEERLNRFQGTQGVALSQIVNSIKENGDLRSDSQYYLMVTVLDQDLDFPLEAE